MRGMKPVAIFRHARTEGPGHFATFLDAHRIPWRIIATDDAQAVPADPAAFSGLAFMGGPMSVNDPLPWIAPTLDVIRRAIDAGIPVIGHCLGAQLISRALGGVVSRNPLKEIGWGEVTIKLSRLPHHGSVAANRSCPSTGTARRSASRLVRRGSRPVGGARTRSMRSVPTWACSAMSR